MPRRSLVAVAALFALALTPAAAQAAVGGTTSITFPSPVTVGQQDVPASITLTNANTAPDAAATNTVCNAGDASPCPAGEQGIRLVPSCSNAAAFQCTGADPDVFAVSSTGVGSGACNLVVFNTSVIDPSFGTVRFTPQPTPATHVALASNGTSCTINFSIDVLKTPVDGDLGQPGKQTGQTTAHTQFSGATTAVVQNTAGGTTVLEATPTIATNASAGTTIGDGGSLTDSATVSGRVNPVAGATVTFNLYGPGDATCANAPVFTSSAVSYPAAGGSVTSSPAFTPTTAGTYRWRATYSGDVNNASVTGACNDSNENVVVAQATPTIFTNASANITIGGGSLTDSATVSGRVNPVAGATVTFNLYGPGDATCANAPVLRRARCRIRSRVGR